MVHVSSSSNTRYAFRLVKGTTPIAVGTVTGNQDAATFTIGSNPDNTFGDSFVLRNQSAAILDTPSTTSATTYKLQGRITYGSGNFMLTERFIQILLHLTLCEQQAQ